MKAVVIGDIGRRRAYHLGDEAMTEVALEMLTSRGVDVVLAAAEPEVSQAFYRTPAVAQVGFAGAGRPRNEALLGQVTDRLAGDPAAEGGLYAAVRDADVAVIAGGGNLNSENHRHLYERVAFTRIAARYGVPLVVSSQTVGPRLRPRDRELLREIVDQAVRFGAREQTTANLVRSIAARPERVVHTLDDAALLSSDPAARRRVAGLDLGKRHIAASLTKHQGATGLSRAEYVGRLAALLAGLAERFDATVALAPHLGSLVEGVLWGDQEVNLEIVAAGGSERLTALPMLTAREDVALIETAMLSVSTRYHPTVFGPAHGTPTGAISLSYYSSVRMRGAMRHTGMDGFVVPSPCLGLAPQAFEELVERGDEVRDHLGRVGTAGHDLQRAWWDSIVDGVRSGTWRHPGELPVVEPLQSRGAWGRSVRQTTDALERRSRKRPGAPWA